MAFSPVTFIGVHHRLVRVPELDASHPCEAIDRWYNVRPVLDDAHIGELEVEAMLVMKVVTDMVPGYTLGPRDVITTNTLGRDGH